MNNLVNVRMLSHPVNWGIVWVVLAVAGYASLFALRSLHAAGGSAAQS